jgi:hypothetical protein
MKWEYLVGTCAKGDLMLDELNKLGEQGWEAIAKTIEGHVLMKLLSLRQAHSGKERTRESRAASERG